MKYMGSKSRIAKHIVPIIQNYIDKTEAVAYIEPFVGGANIIDKINCKLKIGFDANNYLIALLNYIKDDGELLEKVDRDFYSKVRSNVNNNTYPDWIVGNVGFLASYNGRWFDGGYAQSGYEKTKNGERFRDYYQEAKNNLLNQKESLKDIHFDCRDYREIKPPTRHKCIIYCDPPYEGTKQYNNSLNFDHAEFWDTMREWSKSCIVLISEQNAPEDFICIWEKEVSRSIKTQDKSSSTEKLFIHKSNLTTN